MTDRLAAFNQSLALYSAAVLVVFVLALAGGYVYSHEPARDNVVLDIDRSAPDSTETIVSGTIVEVTDGRLVLDQAGSRVEIALPDGVPVEELQRTSTPLSPGTQVNVGGEETRFGFVLTGIVAVEERVP